MSTTMFDAYNLPAFAPAYLPDAEAVEILSEMLDSGESVFARAFPCPRGHENVTVFWTTTPRGEVGTIFEHTRHDAFNVPMGDGDRAVEVLRYRISDAQYDRDAEYAVGE